MVVSRGIAHAESRGKIWGTSCCSSLVGFGGGFSQGQVMGNELPNVVIPIQNLSGVE